MPAQIKHLAMLVAIALVICAGLLAYAAISDVASLTIPNWISLALVGAFAVFALVIGMPLAEIGAHFGFGVAVLCVGFALFQFNIFGGGDAKLFAAASVWAGFVTFLPLLYWTAMAGGLLALALLAARQFAKQTETNPPFVNRLLTGQTGIPYGVAIFAGGLMTLPALASRFHSLTLP
jgi:prepilin peptidase CpaA